MAKKLDLLLVVDLETTCWETREEQGNQPNEIIEIGYTFVDIHRRELGASGSIIVKPRYSKISEFCTRLTTITPEMVDVGVDLGQACAMIEALKIKDRTWASYGDYDRRQFERECNQKDLNYPFGVC